MKKLLFLLLTIIIVGTFVGCQKEPQIDVIAGQKERKIYVPPNGIETRKEP